LETIVSETLVKVKRIHLGYTSDYDTKSIELADRAQLMTSQMQSIEQLRRVPVTISPN
jgi:hypothetical protein